MIHSFVYFMVDDMLEASSDEEETNGIINKVLDEIGIEMSGRVSRFHVHVLF